MSCHAFNQPALEKRLTPDEEKRVSQLTALIPMQGQIMEKTPRSAPHYRAIQNKYNELLLEYRERTGREYEPRGA